MLKLNISNIRIIMAMVITIIQTGCMSIAKTIPLVDNMEIYMMPILDVRKDSSEIVNTSIISGTAQRILLLKGYDVISYEDFTDQGKIDPKFITEMEIKELAKLGPKKYNKLLFIYLNDIGTNYPVIAKTVKIDISVLMIQKDPLKILWSDSSAASRTEVLWRAAVLDRDSVIPTALKYLFERMPEN